MKKMLLLVLALSFTLAGSVQTWAQSAYERTIQQALVKKAKALAQEKGLPNVANATYSWEWSVLEDRVPTPSDYVIAGLIEQKQYEKAALEIRNAVDNANSVRGALSNIEWSTRGKIYGDNPGIGRVILGDTVGGVLQPLGNKIAGSIFLGGVERAANAIAEGSVKAEEYIDSKTYRKSVYFVNVTLRFTNGEMYQINTYYIVFKSKQSGVYRYFLEVEPNNYQYLGDLYESDFVMASLDQLFETYAIEKGKGGPNK